MQPIVLVLLVATSALAAPSIDISVVNANNVAPASFQVGRVSRGLFENAIDNLIDGGIVNTYEILAKEAILNLAASGNRDAEAIGIAALGTFLMALATPTPGNACTAKLFVDAYSTGNPNAYKPALKNHLQAYSQGLKIIARLAQNPESLRNAVGYTGSCAGGGRTYQLEAVWERILENSPPSLYGALNEQYCTAKRLYNVPDARTNSIGTELTAAAVPVVREIIFENYEPAVELATAFATNSNPTAALNKLLAGIQRAINRL